MIGIQNNTDETVATAAGEANGPTQPELAASADGAAAGKTGIQAEPHTAGRKPRSGSGTAEGRKGAGSKSPSTGPAKQDIVLQKLRSAKGATLEALVEATGWQSHSVRGFLSGTVKKKLGLPLASDIGKDGKRRYRIAREPAA